MSKDELVALASKLERISLVGGELTDHECLKVADALRLASRQEMSVTVEELAEFFRCAEFKVGCSYTARSRALLAEYSITKRTTEG